MNRGIIDRIEDRKVVIEVENGSTYTFPLALLEIEADVRDVVIWQGESPDIIRKDVVETMQRKTTNKRF